MSQLFAEPEDQLKNKTERVINRCTSLIKSSYLIGRSLKEPLSRLSVYTNKSESIDTESTKHSAENCSEWVWKIYDRYCVQIIRIPRKIPEGINF